MIIIATLSFAADRAAFANSSRALPTFRSATPDGSKCKVPKPQRLYTPVIQRTGVSIEVFRANSAGSVEPLCTIMNSAFTIDSGGVALDQKQTLWYSDADAPALYAYPLGASTPSQIISGSNTQLIQFPYTDTLQIAVDPQQNIWMPVWYKFTENFGYLVAFKNDANGNAKPVATIGLADKGVGESIGAPVQLVFDREGRLYVIQYWSPGRITVFAPPFKDNSKPIAVWSLSGQTFARFAAIDSKDTLYVGNPSTIFAYDGGLKANGVPTRVISTPSNEGLIDGLACDKKDKLYVSVLTSPNILVFPSKATSWNPIRSFSSPAFSYSTPQTMAISQ